MVFVFFSKLGPEHMLSISGVETRLWMAGS